MKTSIALLFVLFGVNNLVFAQLFRSAYPLSNISADISTISLANSTVAATGRLADHYINPASIGMENTLHISRKNKPFGLKGNLIYQELNARVDRYAFAASFRDINTGEMYAMAYSHPLYIDRPGVQDFIFTGSFAYSFKSGLRLGVGINHGKLENVKYVLQGDDYFREDILKTSFNFGILYQKSILENDKLTLEPSVGLSLSNFGKPIYFYRSDYKSPLPATARLGGAIQVKSKETMLNQPLMGFSITGGLSKIMSRVEEKQDSEGNYHYPSMPPGKALIHSWDKISHYNYNSGNIDTVGLLQQIWRQVGVEMNLMGTLFFRIGLENAGEIEDFLDKVAYGIGLDFYYLQVEYAQSFYKNGYSGGFYGFEEGMHLQFSLRIPLNGNKPDTILHELFK